MTFITNLRFPLDVPEEGSARHSLYGKISPDSNDYIALINAEGSNIIGALKYSRI